MSSTSINSAGETQTSQSAYSQSLLDSSQEANESSQASSRPVSVPTRRQPQQRNRFSYARRKLIAPHSFWLDRNFLNRFTATFPGRTVSAPLLLQGQIQACPTNKNGNVYVVFWNQADHPNLDPAWVCRHYPSTQYFKDLLKDYISAYDDWKRRQDSTGNTSTTNNNNAAPDSRRNQLSPTANNTQQTSTTLTQTDNTQPTLNQVTQTNNTQQLSMSSTRGNNRESETPLSHDSNEPDLPSPQDDDNSDNQDIPSTIERAQRRAQLRTAAAEDGSPALSNLTDNQPSQGITGNTPPTNPDSRPIRLFGSGSTVTNGESGTATENASMHSRRLRRRPNDTEDSSDSESDEDGADPDDDLEQDEQVPRPDNPLEDQNDSDDEDEEETEETPPPVPPPQQNTNAAQQNTNETNENNQPEQTIRQLMDALVFSYQETELSAEPTEWIGKDANHRSMYSGPDGLRNGVSDNFTNPYQCFQFVGGLSNSLIADMATATNVYFHEKIKPNLVSRRGYYHSQKWQNVTLEEMTRFLGIILMMSLRPVDGGGYGAYFQTTNRMYNVGAGQPAIEIKDSAGWASQYMKLARFRQIRGAFHFEESPSRRGGDKCHQLRKLITALNAASKRSFRIPKDMAFDEGGIGCRSRYCPVRQYNKDKPQKFRVDFFILSSSSTYAILHLDVYQGKNTSNAYIRPEAKQLPTTMKAVVNACYALGIHKLTDGYRHLSMDNRYAAPKLAVILRDRLRLFSTGTCRANRIGWNRTKLNLKRTKTNRGNCILFHDPVNGLIFGQWVDSKTVNFVSSYEDSGSGIVLRQVGSQKVEFVCPVPLIRYQMNMGGVDNGDQMRFQFGGFATHSHFKKWYKKSGFAVIDCMLLNSYIAWNLAAGNRPRSRKTKLSRHAFYTIIAQTMCSYVAPQEVDALARRTRNNNESTCNDGHYPVAVESNKQVGCAVCMLEYRWKKQELKMGGLFKNVGRCVKCGIAAHTVACQHKGEEGWKIHNRPEFQNKTCFEILHSSTGKEIFVEADEGSRYTYTVRKNHPVVAELREAQGLTSTLTRKRTRQGAGETQPRRRRRQNENEESDASNTDNENNEDNDEDDEEFEAV